MEWEMAKTITVAEARNRLGSVLREVQETGEPVIVKSRGKPVAVLIAYRDYEEFQRLRAEQHRSEGTLKDA
jgi:prevent-host-death family protein